MGPRFEIPSIPGPFVRGQALVLCVLAMVAVSPRAARAQLIQIKTVPVATGDQFLIFPSDRLSLGGVSIALDDTLGGPFSNPATLGRVEATRVFGSPTTYRISDGNGGATTLPVGALLGSSAWRGGFGMAIQEMDRGRGLINPIFWEAWDEGDLGQRKRTNLYGFGALSRALDPEGRGSIGVSVTAARLHAMGGVDLLYDRATVDQDGHVVDLRLGLALDGESGSTVEAVLVHNRVDMEHELRDWIWEPIPVDGVPESQWPWEVRPVERTEHDETNTWGLHLEYARPLEAEGWRIGGVLTGNRKSHPKIPNYTLMSIPRDPGDSWAFDAGIGISRRTETAVFGIDLVYEPIWTETWADAATPVIRVSGDTIPAGDMTVYNDFQFNNAVVRMGAAGRTERFDVQLGLQLRAYQYTLDQTDFVMERRRRQREDWLEWTPSLGMRLRLDDFSVRYSGRITTGTGRPGAPGGPIVVFDARLAMASGMDFLPAPSGALSLSDVTVQTHQVGIEIPLGPGR